MVGINVKVLVECRFPLFFNSPKFVLFFWAVLSRKGAEGGGMVLRKGCFVALLWCFYYYGRVLSMSSDICLFASHSFLYS